MKATVERGASTVEYALVCIISLTMLFGILEFGRALYTYHFVSHAAREAARWASVNGFTCTTDSSCNGTAPMNNGPASQTDVENFVKGIAPPGIDTSNAGDSSCGGTTFVLAVCTSWPTGTKCTSDAPPTPSGCTPAICFTAQNYAGCTVEVQVSYQFNFLVPLLPNSSMILSSTSQMVIAH